MLDAAGLKADKAFNNIISLKTKYRRAQCPWEQALCHTAFSMSVCAPEQSCWGLVLRLLPLWPQNWILWTADGHWRWEEPLESLGHTETAIDAQQHRIIPAWCRGRRRRSLRCWYLWEFSRWTPDRNRMYRQVVLQLVWREGESPYGRVSIGNTGRNEERETWMEW